jgi:subtilisin family serine protease
LVTFVLIMKKFFGSRYISAFGAIVLAGALFGSGPVFSAPGSPLPPNLIEARFLEAIAGSTNSASSPTESSATSQDSQTSAEDPAGTSSDNPEPANSQSLSLAPGSFASPSPSSSINSSPFASSSSSEAADAPVESTVAANELDPTSTNYIIVFKPAANVDREIGSIGAAKARIGNRFDNAFKGVTARLNDRQVFALSKNPNISFIEKDSSVSLVQPVSLTEQISATWGLDRIDQPIGRDGIYTYSATGSGVTAYVIDTGILSSHSQFGGRVQSGFSSIGGGTQDCNGHGTHVAGTIGSSTFGVAKSVSLVPVRVLDCNGSGTISGVIAGIDWVASQATGGLRVANMSLGGAASSALDTAVNGLINKGVTVVVAAGNNGANACNYSPARVPAAITVAASSSSDSFASYSNRGSCVDIIAPGSSIQSTWHTSNSATNTISGTSMASPHVAGAVALFFQQFGFQSPFQMDQLLKAKGSQNVISSTPAGTANLLLHTDPRNGATATPEPEASVSPSPSPTESTNNRGGRSNNPRGPRG